jgi:hypothetical protein
MATKKDITTNIEVPILKLETFSLKIVGDAPLISHAWSHKAKLMLMHTQQKKASTGREPDRPMVDFAESLYWLSEKPNFDGLTDSQVADLLADVIPKSKFGFPSIAFKAAALDAGFQQGALVKAAGTKSLARTTARGAIRIEDEFAVIEGIPTPREDMVRIGTNGAAVCHRAEFKSWSTTLDITYNKSAITVEQIVNLFRLGGFANGVGDWRPARDGLFGTFHVE